MTRITPPALRAPSVCHLDTGVNRGHPLLRLALQDEHCLAVEPSWSTSDGHPQQHGTNMAGVALYGCLTEVLNSTSRLELRHRLESVKILPDHGKHPPELYGDVTVQAVARIEIQAPDRTQRAFALTVTSDSRDLGSPTSWSAALDQICSGACDEGSPSRLLFVAAGNTDCRIGTSIQIMCTPRALRILAKLGMQLLSALIQRRSPLSHQIIGIGSPLLNTDAYLLQAVRP